MKFFQNSAKFSIILLLLFVIPDLSSAQACGISAFQNPLTIKSSPGFLFGAIQHVANQECTDSGVCGNIPFLCPSSSCCVSIANDLPENITLPSSLSRSPCGCWDSVQNICTPVSSFHIGYSLCDSQTGLEIKRKIEISRGPRETMSEFCEENRAEVQFNVGNETSGVNLEIKLLACSPQSKRMGRQLGNSPVDLAPGFTSGLLSGVFIRDPSLKRGDIMKTFGGFLSRKNQDFASFSRFSNGNDVNQETKASSQCAINAEPDSISMSSNFLSGTTNDFLNLNTGMCWGQGSCKFSSPECQSTSCCLVSTSGDENSSGNSCECLGNGLDILENVSKSCLTNHKVYRVFTSLCTETGEQVERSLSVRIPSSGLSLCISDAESWEKAELKFETNKNGNLEAVVEIRKCILSGANKEFLEIEEIIKAELNVDIVSQLVKKME